jgi:hypothetical protein
MKFNLIKSSLLFCAVLISSIVSGQGISSVSINANQDSYTVSGLSAGVNYNSTNELLVKSAYSLKTNSVIAVYRSFLHFNLSSIPSNAIITSAKIRLRPKVTETSISSTNGTEIYLEAAQSSWDETTITHISGITVNPAVATQTISNLVTVNSVQFREFDVKSQIQSMVEQRILNFGWRIRLQNETTLNAASGTYYSYENTCTDCQPYLAVNYYIPISIVSVVFNHATGSNSNGSITPTLTGGSSVTKSYQWYNSAGTAISGQTNLALTNQPAGWYGLRVTGTDPSDIFYYAFLLGAKCLTRTVTFNPGSNYIDDALYYPSYSGSSSYDQLNFGSSTFQISQETVGVGYIESLIRFRLWIDPSLTLNYSNLTLTGNGHAPTNRPNASYLKLLSSNWAELSVAKNNAPSDVSTGQLTINGIAAGNGNATIDINGFMNVWKSNNLLNYGLRQKLTFYEGSNTKMSFNSSDASTGKPYITINFTSTDCSDNQFAVLKEDLGPEIYSLPSSKIIRFRWTDYFSLGGYINYSVKSISDDSLPPSPLAAATSTTNWIQINTTSWGLIAGNIYVLEVSDNQGKKFYLKFKA